MNRLEIKKMSRLERLQAIEALWDSLLDEETEVESPDWHRGILEERKERSKPARQNSFLLRD